MALVCALKASSFEEAIRNAIYIGGDTDTIACIAGGLAEALYGIPAPLVEESQPYLPGAFLEVLQRLYAAAAQPMPLAGSITARPSAPSHHVSAGIMDWINAFFI